MSSADPSSTLVLLQARWVAPIDQPPICNGAVVFGGGVVRAVGTAAAMRRAWPGARQLALDDSAILPGLVNAHVHLELSALSPGERPARFVDWLKRLVPQTPAPPEAIRAFAENGVRAGVAQCLRFGVTTVGDISRQCAVTRPMLSGGPLCVVSFGEVQAMARRRGFLDERLAAAADSSGESGFLRAGISPHAPYSVEAAGYRRCLEIARQRALPLATHLAETRDEAEFLADHYGPFRELWEYLGDWDDAVPTFAGGPIRYAHALGLLDYPCVLAHVNYCDDDELAILAAGRASVVYCPRTHAWFDHPPHRWREMLSAGINVAIGTDSCASSPDLNLVDDLRLLHRIYPQVPADELWESATLRGARALGLENIVGSITPGKSADLIALGAVGNNPLQEILEEADRKPTHVWIRGVPVPE